MSWFTIVIALIAFTVPRINGQSPPTAPPALSIDVDRIIENSECYDPLFRSDTDGNGRVEEEEYVTFINEVSDGYFEYVEGDPSLLPLELTQTFNYLACLCRQYGGGSDCCTQDNAHISTAGTGKNETPTEDQTSYLYVVCLETFFAIDEVATAPPSDQPTQGPTTGEPSYMPTFPPTNPPTLSPTPNPTRSPTFSPTRNPTNIPTTSKPTPFPTDSPTMAPIIGTRSPTLSPKPTSNPTTVEPTSTPTRLPTPEPTDAPTASPSFTPTPVPSTAMPTLFTGILEVQTIIFIVKRSISSTVNQTLLEEVVDLLSAEVVSSTFPSRRMIRRRLLVTFESGSEMRRRMPINCPTDFELDPGGSCERVSMFVPLSLEEEDMEQVRSKFVIAFNEAVNSGRLQELLDMVDSSAPIFIYPPTIPTPSPTANPVAARGLPTSATVSLASVAALALVTAAFGLFVSRRNREEKEELPRGGPDASSSSTRSRPSRSSHAYTGTLGASSPNYGRSKKHRARASFASLDDGDSEDGRRNSRGVDDSGESSSNAGSSGWSSSAGISSLNTESLEDEQMVGSTLAAIGAASAVTKRVTAKAGRGGVKYSPIRQDKPPKDNSKITKKDLDSAIEAGDWAAVGATAALLAANSETQSQSSKVSLSTRSKTSTISSVDPARVAELDQLVDAGDWEGVVLAAARLESEGSVVSATSDERGIGAGSTASKRSADMSAGTSSVYSPSVATSVSETPSKAQKRAEIRKEVEALVRRVVPDEIDNVDEMMLQFKGREEELVETLRTMQERSIAQRARAAVHKSAKREARRSRAESTNQSRYPLPPGGPPSRRGSSKSGASAGKTGRKGRRDSAENSNSNSEDFSDPQFYGSSGGKTSSLSSDNKTEGKSKSASNPTRTALELAIEAGDWEAVGEAAAMMSDNSVTSGSTNELGSRGYDTDGTGGTGGTSAGSKGVSKVNAERAAELDVMIDRGDWTGVVMAASRYTTLDGRGGGSKSGAGSSASSGSKRKKRGWTLRKTKTSKSSDSDSGSVDKDRTLQEEQDALAQAEIWMAIAAQSRTDDTAETKGASDAADWAISRSLSALRSAERKGDLSSKTTGSQAQSSGASTGGGSSQGDKSV